MSSYPILQLKARVHTWPLPRRYGKHQIAWMHPFQTLSTELSCLQDGKRETLWRHILFHAQLPNSRFHLMSWTKESWLKNLVCLATSSRVKNCVMKSIQCPEARLAINLSLGQHHFWHAKCMMIAFVHDKRRVVKREIFIHPIRICWSWAACPRWCLNYEVLFPIELCNTRFVSFENLVGSWI